MTLSLVCALDKGPVYVLQSLGDAHSSTEQRGNPAVPSHQTPSVFRSASSSSRSTTTATTNSLTHSLISSHPASRESFTLRGHNVKRVRGGASGATKPRRALVPSSSATSLANARPASENTSSVLAPPPLLLPLLLIPSFCPRLSARRGMEGTGQLTASEHGPPRLPPHCAGAASDR